MDIYLVGGTNEKKEDCSLAMHHGKDLIVFGEIYNGGVGTKMIKEIQKVLINHLGLNINDLKVRIDCNSSEWKGDGTFETGLELLAKQMREFKKEFK